MNATHFTHPFSHFPLNFQGPGVNHPWWPVVPNLNDSGNGYVKFKEINGDKGLRNAVHHYWNAKKFTLTVSGGVNYHYYPENGTGHTQPASIALSKTHTTYGSKGGLYAVSPAPLSDDLIPQPASKSRMSTAFHPGAGFQHYSPSAGVLPYKTDEDFDAALRFNSILFVTSLDRWVCSISINGALTGRKWNAARDNRLGHGYVNFYFLNATDAVLPGYSTSAVTLPEMFEGGNRLVYLVGGTNENDGSAPYPKPTGTISAAVTDAEYWTYD